MKQRIPLCIVEGRLVLVSVIGCPKLRVPLRKMDFVVDTGSPDSYISDRDVRLMQIPIKDKSAQEEVDFGGSRFKRISLPPFTMHLLKEGFKEKTTLTISLSALKTTKMSDKKKEAAQMLPSILGLDFLREQKLALPVILNENVAYLEMD